MRFLVIISISLMTGEMYGRSFLPQKKAIIINCMTLLKIRFQAMEFITISQV